MESIPIFSLLNAISHEFGQRAARHQIVVDLRQGEMKARCATFKGLNASRFSVTNYPDLAEDFVLPPSFWSMELASEGEQDDTYGSTVVHFYSSWAEGNFSVSGTYSGGRLPFSRRATGVAIDRSLAMKRMQALGLDPMNLRVTMRASDDEIRDKLRAFFRTHGVRGMDAMEPFREEILGIDRAHFRELHREVKSEFG